MIRRNKGVQFTAQGEYLVENSKKLLSDTEEIIEHVQNMNQEIRGTLKLGVANNFALYKLPSILSGFVENYPKVKIMLRTGRGTEVIQMLTDHEIHIGIESNGSRWAEEKVLINSEQICIISKQPIEIEKLPSLPMIKTSTPSVEKIYVSWWPKRFSSPPIITMETDFIETCKRMVNYGLGVAFLPKFCMNPEDSLHFVDLPENDDKSYLMESWMNYRKSSLDLSVVNAFVEFVGGKSW